uniref:Uncharacterized protein n=1 Tax=Octopus bimaculoides TaxID=37653 RepID=A0A0L8H7I9_OCTBM
MNIRTKNNYHLDVHCDVSNRSFPSTVQIFCRYICNVFEQNFLSQTHYIKSSLKRLLPGKI